MDFEQWVRYGVQHDWISREFCLTHDMWPYTHEEGALVDDGDEPCAFAVRFKEPGQEFLGGREGW